jgi:hypothetical protein
MIPSLFRMIVAAGRAGVAVVLYNLIARRLGLTDKNNKTFVLSCESAWLSLISFIGRLWWA